MLGEGESTEPHTAHSAETQHVEGGALHEHEHELSASVCTWPCMHQTDQFSFTLEFTHIIIRANS